MKRALFFAIGVPVALVAVAAIVAAAIYETVSEIRRWSVLL